MGERYFLWQLLTYEGIFMGEEGKDGDRLSAFITSIWEYSFWNNSLYKKRLY